MFAKLAAFTALFVTLAAANPLPDVGSPSQCNTGPVQCCDQLQDPTDVASQGLLSILNLNLQDVNGQLGLQCNPINVIGLGQGADCSAHPVCCDNTRQVNGIDTLIGISCIPVSLD
ncbi:fungal hydrophobin [Trametes coccinea BRFM310]|uniref:Hydrophobin n=1 Tax=Trametes coccinea (strain BRFM310) TaxID=1353009 RepID=A0A1Y2I5M6_TRAC3|nr:fungal hydrophobin [Trametes coccinea BRFM310]